MISANEKRGKQDYGSLQDITLRLVTVISGRLFACSVYRAATSELKEALQTNENGEFVLLKGRKASDKIDLKPSKRA